MIPLFKPYMPKSVMKPLREVLLSGFIGEGQIVKNFEQGLGNFIGNSNVLATNSGTSAIQLALRLSDVGPGDYVISSPMTCVATNEPVLAAGAKIIWADIDPETGNISPESIEKKMTPKVKAIILVHWGGYPADLKEINQIAKAHGARVIEDAAHALGSKYKKQRIGCHSDFVCFSFQAIKHITTVDGGALVCKRKRDCKRGKLLRWYGLDRELNWSDSRFGMDIKEWGYKFHMNDVAATIGVVQLKYLPSLIENRQKQAQYYIDHLTGIWDITLPKIESDRISAYWLFPIQTKRSDAFMKKMKMAGIMVSKVHRRNDKYTIFKDCKSELPGLEKYYRGLMCIPIGYWITKKEQVGIVETIKEGW